MTNVKSCKTLNIVNFEAEEIPWIRAITMPVLSEVSFGKVSQALLQLLSAE